MAKESLDTIVVHAAADPSRNLGTLSTPVYQSAVFPFPDADQAAAISQGEQPRYSYGRKGNPAQTALETTLCELEGEAVALAQLSIAWLLSHQVVCSVIPGVNRMAQLEDNVLSPSIAIGQEELAEIDALTRDEGIA